MKGMFSASRRLLTPKTRCIAGRREDCTVTVWFMVKLATAPVASSLGCTFIVPKEISSLRAPAARSALRIWAVQPFNCVRAAEVVDCVLATFAVHSNELEVTDCSAEPVIVIWLEPCG